jgi:hypothetical protein
MNDTTKGGSKIKHSRDNELLGAESSKVTLDLLLALDDKASLNGLEQANAPQIGEVLLVNSAARE